MDHIVHAALEEICSLGINGVSLPDLWPKLQKRLSSSSGLHLCDGVKKAIWNGILNIPGIRFEDQNSSLFDSRDPSIQSVEEFQKMKLKIVASEHLRDCFVGIYDLRIADAGISRLQRRVLDRLAIARDDGITQVQLVKEFGIEANKIFYVLKSLECRGLIVKQLSTVRTKEAQNGGENGSKKKSTVTTNLIHLQRYVKHFGHQQSLEFTKEESVGNGDGSAVVGDGVAGECVKEDVLVKDYISAMKAVSDKLEEAKCKVLVVSDIKWALGYQGDSRDKFWRNIFTKLKDAGVVEQFRAIVNKKEVHCLRLLKKFAPENFQLRSVGCERDGFYTDQPVKCEKRGQITDQIVELPIECQVYDMIDAEGLKGLTITKICKRLGLNSKMYHTRLLNVFSKYGMHLQSEKCKRGMAYRVRTSRNFSNGSNTSFRSQPDDIFDESLHHMKHVEDPVLHKKSSPVNPHLDASISKDEFLNTGKMNNGQMGLENFHVSPVNVEKDQILIGGSNTQNFVHELGGSVSDSNVSPMGASSSNVSNASKTQCRPRYLCLTSTTESAQREQRILDLLQDEKFILRVELYRWLESNGKDKCTTMARKTLSSILDKLQQKGFCKRIKVSVPFVTNYEHHRKTEVILHPSVQNLAPELLCQIYDRLRSFDMQSRGRGLARPKTDHLVPVLPGVQRVRNNIKSDVSASRSGAIHANGFVLRKMVRAKMLHNFLWGYLSGLHDLDDALSSGKRGYDLENPHSNCKLFSLDAAIKTLPLELFLQVVGSAQKFEDLIESCKNGTLLSDLPLREYRCLMNTRAAGRLSQIIDILYRLKLIRLVNDGRAEDAYKVPHAILTHAMELKPYIEELLSIVPPSSSVSSLDLRQTLRHDFILTNREAIDGYWKTLKRCYAGADRTAALHIFPGCAVPEVLQVYNNKGRKRLNRFQQDLKPKKMEFPQVMNDCNSNSQKRNRSSEARPSKQVKIDTVYGSGDYEIHMQADGKDDYLKHVEESGEDEDKKNYISLCALPGLRTTRRRNFYWTEMSDRQLVIQYVRTRATLGAKFHRINWGAVPDLPAPPSTCKTRMTTLNSNVNFRKAILRLCNVLSERYVKHLDRTMEKEILLRDAYGQMIQYSSVECSGRNLSSSLGHALDSNSGKQPWDDFENQNVKMALDEVLRFKQMAKLDASNRVVSISDKRSDAPGYDPEEESELVYSTTPSEKMQNHVARQRKDSFQTSSYRHLPKKVIELLNERKSDTQHANISLAVSNAIELLKLVFLSTSTALEVSNLLIEALRCYSEHELFSAFNYLKEKNFMVGGNGSQPPALSKQFLKCISSSPFPINTGQRAAKFASWLHENENDIMDGEVILNADLQCGDIFQLFALVYLGELVISPCLPDEGVGEAEEQRGLKRKTDKEKLFDDTVKKQKSLFNGEFDFESRRKKGFPGIVVSLNRATISRADPEELKKKLICSDPLLFDENGQVNFLETGSNLSDPDHVMAGHKYGCTVPISGASSEFPWKAMTSYAEHLKSTIFDLEQSGHFCPELFRNVYTAIQKSGDKGLSMGMIPRVMQMQGEKMLEITVDVLQSFGLVVKVNGFDCVHVIDALHRSKYFLTIMAGCSQYLKPAAYMKAPWISDDGHVTLLPEDHKIDMHQVTNSNPPEEISGPSNETQSGNKSANYMLVKVVSPERAHESEIFKGSSDDYHSFRPIFPWINGDGTTNMIVYKGLTRRVLGTVTQNPGILEDDLIRRMDVLNPQSCRKLLELMVLDNHLIVRKMQQTTPAGPPAILRSLLGSSFKRPKLTCVDHFFANPLSASLL